MFFSFFEIIYIFSCVCFVLIVVNQSSTNNGLSSTETFSQKSVFFKFNFINRVCLFLILIYFSLSVFINIENKNTVNSDLDNIAVSEQIIDEEKK